MHLEHDLQGTGPTTVLLHSGVCDRRMWQPQTRPLLAAGHQVLTPDFRGYGDTPAPTAEYDNARDILDLLDTHGIAQATLVGSSFGGRIAQEIAARWPERVNALALICPDLRGHPPTPAVKAFGNREDELLEAGDLEAAVDLNVTTFLGPLADDATRKNVADMQRRAFELQINAGDVARIDVDYDISAITARTLVFSGGHDLDYFQQIAEHVASTIPGARHTRLDWAGHLPSLEDPAALNPLLLDFLDQRD